jgi:hypothetical protein
MKRKLGHQAKIKGKMRRRNKRRNQLIRMGEDKNINSGNEDKKRRQLRKKMKTDKEDGKNKLVTG